MGLQFSFRAPVTYLDEQLQLHGDRSRLLPRTKQMKPISHWRERKGVTLFQLQLAARWERWTDDDKKKNKKTKNCCVALGRIWRQIQPLRNKQKTKTGIECRTLLTWYTSSFAFFGFVFFFYCYTSTIIVNYKTTAITSVHYIHLGIYRQERLWNVFLGLGERGWLLWPARWPSFNPFERRDRRALFFLYLDTKASHGMSLPLS